MKRYSKTIAQQCKYYEVDNIFVYMVETYLNGNITVFEKLFWELCKEARKDFIRLPSQRGGAYILERNSKNHGLTL